MTHPRGNLVVNGGFESGSANQPPPSPWFSDNVEIVGAGALAYSGLQSAALGETTPTDPAFLCQDVPVAPGRYYELTFHVSGDGGLPSPIRAEVRWLDTTRRDLGVGLSIFISGANTGIASEGGWLSIFELTGQSPHDAALARIVFSRSDGNGSPMLLDDVLFADES